MDVWLSPEPDTWVRAVFFYLPIKSVLYPLSTPTQSLSRVSVCCNDTYACCEYGCLWDRHLGAAWVQPHREGPWNWKITIPGWGHQGKSDCFSSSSFVSWRTSMCLFRCAHQYTEYLYLKQAWSCISYQMYLGDFLSCLNSIKAKVLYRNKERSMIFWCDDGLFCLTHVHSEGSKTCPDDNVWFCARNGMVRQPNCEIVCVCGQLLSSMVLNPIVLSLEVCSTK